MGRCLIPKGVLLVLLPLALLLITPAALANGIGPALVHINGSKPSLFTTWFYAINTGSQPETYNLYVEPTSPLAPYATISNSTVTVPPKSAVLFYVYWNFTNAPAGYYPPGPNLVCVEYCVGNGCAASCAWIAVNLTENTPQSYGSVDEGTKPSLIVDPKVKNITVTEPLTANTSWAISTSGSPNVTAWLEGSLANRTTFVQTPGYLNATIDVSDLVPGNYSSTLWTEHGGGYIILGSDLNLERLYPDLNLSLTVLDTIEGQPADFNLTAGNPSGVDIGAVTGKIQIYDSSMALVTELPLTPFTLGPYSSYTEGKTWSSSAGNYFAVAQVDYDNRTQNTSAMPFTIWPKLQLQLSSSPGYDGFAVAPAHLTAKITNPSSLSVSGVSAEVHFGSQVQSWSFDLGAGATEQQSFDFSGTQGQYPTSLNISYNGFDLQDSGTEDIKFADILLDISAFEQSSRLYMYSAKAENPNPLDTLPIDFSVEVLETQENHQFSGVIAAGSSLTKEDYLLSVNGGANVTIQLNATAGSAQKSIQFVLPRDKTTPCKLQKFGDKVVDCTVP